MPVGAVIAIATVIGLGLRLYQLARPGFLLGAPLYDDGVDFGSAIRLVDGFVPYRDFAFVQPPGITLLLTPVALLAKATSTDTGFALARILTACVGAASVPLVGLLVRHHGALATALVCGIVALHTDAVFAASTVFLEPWLVLFCLLGAISIFEADQLTGDSRRLASGGLAFGFAGAVKAWAALPVLVILVLYCRDRNWRRPWVFLGGVVVGFCLPAAPFIALAPRAFFHNVVTAQLSRGDLGRAPIATRLSSLLGISHQSLPSVDIIALVVVLASVVVICSIWASLRMHQPPPPLELFALMSSALILGSFLWPADYYSHYAAFFAPFLAMSVVLPGARLLSAVAARKPAVGGMRVAAALIAIAIVAVAAHELVDETRLAAAGRPVVAQREISPGACVLADNPSFTIAANRFESDMPRCPPLIDAIGTDYLLGDGRNGLTGAGQSPAVQAAWRLAFDHAKYVWLSCGPPAAPACNQYTNRRIPWTRPTLAYFYTHFRRLGQAYFLYERDRA